MSHAKQNRTEQNRTEQNRTEQLKLSNNGRQGLSISACLIVKNEALHLANCLESLQGLVDEIILVDTGSTDDTLAIAQNYTDKIYHYTWHDDFAAARNYGLQFATGDWIMIIDADETLPESTARLIPQYLRAHADQSVVLNWRVVSEHQPDLYSRGLFPNHHGIHFAGRVHEIPVMSVSTKDALSVNTQHLSTLRQAQGDSFIALPSYHCHDLVIEHQNTAPNSGKSAYYQRLLEQMVTETTDLRLHNHALKHLGLSYLAQDQWQEAKDTLTDCFAQFEELSITPEDGFYQEVLQGLKHATACLHTAKSSRSVWPKRIAAAVSLSLLAACQSTAPSTLKSPQKPILLSEVPDLRDTSSQKIPASSQEGFRIQDVYLCPGPSQSGASACYQSGGVPRNIENWSVDEDGNACGVYNGCCNEENNYCVVYPCPTPADPTATVQWNGRCVKECKPNEERNETTGGCNIKCIDPEVRNEQTGKCVKPKSPKLHFVASFNTEALQEEQALSELASRLLVEEPETASESDFQITAENPLPTDAKEWEKYFGWFVDRPGSPVVINPNQPVKLDVKGARQAAKSLQNYLKSKGLPLGRVISKLNPLKQIKTPFGDLFELFLEEIFFPEPANPITVAVTDMGGVYGNIVKPQCKPIGIEAGIRLEEWGKDPVYVEFLIFQVETNREPKLIKSWVSQQALAQNNDVQYATEFWDMLDQDGSPVPTGNYALILRPVTQNENTTPVVTPENSEGVTFLLRLIDPVESTNQFHADLLRGFSLDFTTMILSDSEARGLESTIFDQMEQALKELDIAANYTAAGTNPADPSSQPDVTKRGLGLVLPDKFLYGSDYHFSGKPTNQYYVSALAPYEGLRQNMKMYDLAGLIKYIYKGDEILDQAIVNTECRNPYVHVFLKTLKASLESLGENLVANTPARRPPLGGRSLSITQQNDVIKLISDSPLINRLSFSNALDSLDYFHLLPLGTINRMVGGPGFEGGDVFFRDNSGKLIKVNEHKNQVENPTTLTPNFIRNRLTAAPKQLYVDNLEIKSDPSIYVNLIIQIHQKNQQTDQELLDIINEGVSEAGKKVARGQTCKDKYHEMTLTVLRPNGNILTFQKPICP